MKNKSKMSNFKSSEDCVETPILENKCEFRQFDMRLFHEFPSDLPKEVVQSLNDDHLDEQAVLSIYKEGVILNSLDEQNGPTLWSCNFRRVHIIFVDQNTNQQFVFSITDEKEKPNHYLLVRTLNSDDYATNFKKALLQAYFDADESERAEVQKISLPSTPELARKVVESESHLPDPIIQTECEYRLFDMRLFHEFPAALPKKIWQSFKEKHLDEKAVIKVYEEGVVLEHKNVDKLHSANFKNMPQIYVKQLRSTNKQFVFTVEDENSRPNHCVLIRTLKNAKHFHETLTQTYSARDGLILVHAD